MLTSVQRRVPTWLRSVLWDMSARDDNENPSEQRRRRVVCVLTVLAGTVVLGVTLRTEPGSRWFYPCTVLLALVWAVGAFASGTIRLGRGATGRWFAWPVLRPLLAGLGLAGLFLLGARLVRDVPVLADEVRAVLDHSDQGVTAVLVLVTAVSGVAEEFFFRGALYAAIPRHPILWTTVAYTATTAATGNVMLAFAAACLGVVVGFERRASGGILGPAITHLAWSLPMLVLLPTILG